MEARNTLTGGNPSAQGQWIVLPVSVATYSQGMFGRYPCEIDFIGTCQLGLDRCRCLLFFGARMEPLSMEPLHGTTLNWRATLPDRVWALNPAAYKQPSSQSNRGNSLSGTRRHSRGRRIGWFRRSLWRWRLEGPACCSLNSLQRRLVESYATVIIPFDERVILVRLLNGAEFSSRPSEVAQALDAISGIEWLVSARGIDERWPLGTI
jgi:hypothetical protein